MGSVCDLDCFHFSPVTTSHRSVKTTTLRPLVITTSRPLVTATTRRATQTTRSSIRVTTQTILSTTSSTLPDRNKTTRTATKPTVHSFWSEWSPTNDLNVEILTAPTANSIKPTQNSNSSKIVMAPWLQEILNEAIESNNISTTTQRSLNQLSGGGFNDIDIENSGER